MREICLSGSMSGMWKRHQVALLRHRQTKEAETDMWDLRATAPHLNSTNCRSIGASRRTSKRDIKSSHYRPRVTHVPRARVDITELRLSFDVPLPLQNKLSPS